MATAEFTPPGRPPIDLAGKRFGKWTALHRTGDVDRKGQLFWACVCDCGTTRPIVGYSLRRGQSTSCGCLYQHGATHHMTLTQIYKIWRNMKSRCLNPNNRDYKNYGARGITICERWRDSFENFYHDMGEMPSAKLTLERKDNDGPYSPENVVWATYKTQANNTRWNRLITYNKETHTLSQWADHLGLPYHTLKSRLSKLLWGVERSFTTPLQRQRHN